MTHEQDPIAVRPNAVPWPPLLYIGAIAAGLALEQLWPTASMMPAGLRWPGWMMLAVGAALDGSAMITMARARANILPHRAATALVTWGPFRWSRNPIYLGNTVMTVGAALAFAVPWLLASAAAAAIATHHLAIRREEAHLDARFAEAWRAYAARTPRWLGPI